MVCGCSPACPHVHISASDPIIAAITSLHRIGAARVVAGPQLYRVRGCKAVRGHRAASHNCTMLHGSWYSSVIGYVFDTVKGDGTGTDGRGRGGWRPARARAAPTGCTTDATGHGADSCVRPARAGRCIRSLQARRVQQLVRPPATWGRTCDLVAGYYCIQLLSILDFCVLFFAAVGSARHTHMACHSCKIS